MTSQTKKKDGEVQGEEQGEVRRGEVREAGLD